MKIAYCTRLIPHIPHLYEKYPNSKFIVSVDRFIMNQITGVEKITGDKITIINIPEVPSYPRFPAVVMKQIDWSRSEENKDIDIGFLNLPIIRQIIVPYKVKRHLKKWCRDNRDEKKVMLTYSTNPMSMSALVQLKKKDRNIKTVLVVGDLIGDKGINIKGKGLLNKLLNLYYQRGDADVSQFDGYILLTNYMAEELGVKQKPYIVIEGIYNKENEQPAEKPKKEDKNDLKVIFHAGSLERQYGVFDLINAFSMISDDNYRLWLAGGSSESEEIKKRCEEDPRIEYFGFISPQQVYELQERATVIINPRTADGEFTKYSFPSKTMEGLASGKPFIGYRLPGIPDEYFNYIQVVEDNNIESLCQKIKEVCELSESSRNEIGQKAREFILNKKNNIVQGEKIVKFLNSI